MRTTPRWVIRLAEEVCSDGTLRPYNVRVNVPLIKWHVSKVNTFHGTCYGGYISITVSSQIPRKAQKALLLHELAHWLTPGYKHDAIWGECCCALFVRYGIGPRDQMSRYRSVKAAFRARRREKIQVDGGSPRRLFLSYPSFAPLLVP